MNDHTRSGTTQRAAGRASRPEDGPSTGQHRASTPAVAPSAADSCVAMWGTLRDGAVGHRSPEVPVCTGGTSTWASGRARRVRCYAEPHRACARTTAA